MNILHSHQQSTANFFPKTKAAPNSQPDDGSVEQPKESWSPLTLGSSLGAVIGAGVSAVGVGPGLTAGLVGFGTAFAAAKLLHVERYEDNGLFLFGLAAAATVAASCASGPGGVALLALAGGLAYALNRQYA